MRIEQLRYIIEIAKCKTLTNAAEHLYLTPQSLSRSVSTMEKELGVKLLDRNFSGFEFTESGKLFLEMAKTVLREYDHTIVQLQQGTHGNCVKQVQGKIQLFSHQVFMTSVLPNVISDFCANYPSVSVEVREGNLAYAFYHWMHAEQTERSNRIGLFGTTPENIAEWQFKCEQNGWRFQPSFTTKYCVCVSTDSPLARQKTICLNHLLTYPLVRFSGGEDQGKSYLTTVLQAYGTPQTVFATSSIAGWVHAVQSNLGVGIINDIVLKEDSLVKDEFEKIKILHLKENIERITGLLYDKDASPVVQAFVDAFPQYRW